MHIFAVSGEGGKKTSLSWANKQARATFGFPSPLLTSL